MKKTLALLLCLSLVAVGAGCTAPPAEEAAYTLSTAADDVIIVSPTEPYEATELELPMHAIALPTVRDRVQAEDGTVIFTRTYQNIQILLSGSETEASIQADLRSRMDSFLQDASAIERCAQEDYSSQEHWTPYYAQSHYTPTRIDQSVLSLYGIHQSYSGGSHPALVTGSINYDLTTGAVLTLGDILVEGWSGEKLADMICKVLEPKAEELYPNYDTVIKDRFDNNADSIQDWYLTEESLCFHFSPYDIAAPYAGIVTAQIPYKELDTMLKEQYLPKSVTANGSVYAEVFTQTAAQRFSSIAEVTLDGQGTPILLYPDATVTDLRIEVGEQTENGFVSSGTVFAADPMGLGNCIRLQADLSEGASALRLVYHSDGQDISALLRYDSENGLLQLV